MIQFLNNIWIILNTQDAELVNLLVLPLFPIENYIVMSLFISIFSVSANRKQKIVYIAIMSLVSIINQLFIPSPFNIFINYFCIFILIKTIFRLNILKSIISLLVSVFIVVLLNVLFQNPYITILKIGSDTFINTPIYRIVYLIFIYSFGLIICLSLKKFKKLKFTFDYIDNLDKKTVVILIINLFIGFLTLGIQLIITAYYIDIVPIIITILNFILLISFFMLSIYSFTRMIKLSITTKELQSAEEYNKSLEILYDKVNGFKHDFDNILSTFSGYIDNNDMPGLKSYFSDIRKDSKITTDLAILNPRSINNPGIYSLIYNKYFKAYNIGVTMNIEFFLDLSILKVNTYQFSRMLGILLDNAIEAASTCDEKIVRVIFRREQVNNRSLVIVENTYSNKEVNTEEIFEKGVSGKEKHSGIGLWEVKNYVSKSNNLNLFTTKNDKYFIQQLEIYDELRSVV